jgi:hypothetical protein
MARIAARHRFARIAATKVRPFADLIRGEAAGDGLLLLRFKPNRGARMLEKVLKSAIANCEDRGARNVDSLKIVEAVRRRRSHVQADAAPLARNGQRHPPALRAHPRGDRRSRTGLSEAAAIQNESKMKTAKQVTEN